MNSLVHISESLENIFFIKTLKFFDADLGSGIQDEKNSDPGSGMEKTQIRDPENTYQIRNIAAMTKRLTLVPLKPLFL
jgi:hypothetical protein